MPVFGRLETEVAAKAPAYKFHEVNSKRIHETAKICPKYFQKIDLKEGEWGGEGSVTCCDFIIGRINKRFLICCSSSISYIFGFNVLYVRVASKAFTLWKIQYSPLLHIFS